jgi:hypothetical protein
MTVVTRCEDEEEEPKEARSVAEPTTSPALSDYSTAHRVIALVALFLTGFFYICSR